MDPRPMGRHGPRLAGVTLALALLALGAGSGIGWPHAAMLLAGLVIGLMLHPALLRRLRRGAPSEGVDAAERVTRDVRMLRKAFGVLQEQVSTTIGTSEAAVLAMTERIARVHQGSHGLHQTMLEAVAHANHVSGSSLAQSDLHAQALAAVAEHLERERHRHDGFRQALAEISRAVQDLQSVNPRTQEIAHQAHLLANRAAIEAAGAGPEGAGFKGVAAEAHRLSAQAAEAARRVSDGIDQAARSLEREMKRPERVAWVAPSATLPEIARHMRDMHATLGTLVPYLQDLSGRMAVGMDEVNRDILAALGEMQFQDINRQLLEQLHRALGGLSEHFTQLYALIEGRAPPPPVLLEELMDRWQDSYVMLSQHLAHSRAATALYTDGQLPAATLAAAPRKPEAASPGAVAGVMAAGAAAAGAGAAGDDEAALTQGGDEHAVGPRIELF